MALKSSEDEISLLLKKLIEREQSLFTLPFLDTLGGTIRSSAFRTTFEMPSAFLASKTW